MVKRESKRKGRELTVNKLRELTNRVVGKVERDRNAGRGRTGHGVSMSGSATGSDDDHSASTFLGLTDTPGSYDSNAVLAVNGAGDAVLFADGLDWDDGNHALTIEDPAALDGIIVSGAAERIQTTAGNLDLVPTGGSVNINGDADVQGGVLADDRVLVERSNPGSAAISTRHSGAGNDVARIEADGRIEWGVPPGGSSNRDTYLYRNAAQQLGAESSLRINNPDAQGYKEPSLLARAEETISAYGQQVAHDIDRTEFFVTDAGGNLTMGGLTHLGLKVAHAKLVADGVSGSKMSGITGFTSILEVDEANGGSATLDDAHHFLGRRSTPALSTTVFRVQSEGLVTSRITGTEAITAGATTNDPDHVDITYPDDIGTADYALSLKGSMVSGVSAQSGSLSYTILVTVSIDQSTKSSSGVTGYVQYFAYREPAGNVGGKGPYSNYATMASALSFDSATIPSDLDKVDWVVIGNE